MKVTTTAKWGDFQKGSEVEILDNAVLKAGFNTGLFEKTKENKKEIEDLFKEEVIEIKEDSEGQKIEFVNEKTAE